jgi:cytochrome c biogenesis protein CcmG, thiol:disulfide interchange protein DsbE
LRRFLFPGVVVAVAVALLALLVFGISSQGTNTSIDNAIARGIDPPAPQSQMALPVLGSSQKKSLADYRGKILVVNVFASWCSPCRAEAPILDREQRTLAAHDGTIVGVSYQDTPSDSLSFVRQEHITYPVLRDVGGNLSRSWGVNGVPETFVINRQGRIVALRRYELANGTWLEDAVAPLLGDPS